MKYQILKSFEFIEWLEQQNPKTQEIINARLDRIHNEGHFGLVHRFDGLIELKWISGIRVYTFIHEEVILIVLFGGNKNGQDKDIQKAKKIRQSIFR